MTTAIKITPEGEVTEVELGSNTLRGMYREIGCDTVDVVRVTPDLDMWVDDEGLIVADPQLNRPATILLALARPVHQWICGTVLLMGNTADGESIAPPADTRDIAEHAVALATAGAAL